MTCENQYFFKYLLQEGFEETTSKTFKQSYFEIIEGKYSPYRHLRTFKRRDIVFFFDLSVLTVTNNGKFIACFIFFNTLENTYFEIPDKIISIVGDPNRYVSPKIRKLIMQLGYYECAKCGSTERLEIDHIIPVSRGGGNEYGNLQVLCKTCNLKKSNKINQ